IAMYGYPASAAGGVLWSQSIRATPAAFSESVLQAVLKLIPQPPQLLPNRHIQLRPPRHLLAQLFGELDHLVGKGFVVVFDRLGADVAAGREHMAVLSDLGQGHAAAEAGNVFVGGCFDKLSTN